MFAAPPLSLPHGVATAPPPHLPSLQPTTPTAGGMYWYLPSYLFRDLQQ